MAADKGDRVEERFKQSQAEKDAFEVELDVLDKKIARLRVLYDQYFMGIEKVEPHQIRGDVAKIFMRSNIPVRGGTALKFRYRGLQQRFVSYCSYWDRVVRLIEDGRIRRGIGSFKSEDSGLDVNRAEAEEGGDHYVRPEALISKRRRFKTREYTKEELEHQAALQTKREAANRAAAEEAAGTAGKALGTAGTAGAGGAEGPRSADSLFDPQKTFPGPSQPTVVVPQEPAAAPTAGPTFGEAGASVEGRGLDRRVSRSHPGGPESEAATASSAARGERRTEFAPDEIPLIVERLREEKQRAGEAADRITPELVEKSIKKMLEKVPASGLKLRLVEKDGRVSLAAVVKKSS